MTRKFNAVVLPDINCGATKKTVTTLKGLYDWYHKGCAMASFCATKSNEIRMCHEIGMIKEKVLKIWSVPEKDLFLFCKKYYGNFSSKCNKKQKKVA